MKLIRFTAKKVFGYLDFNMKFKSNLTFLTGGNGSGKTTALRLIQALLTPSIKELNIIAFDSIHLEMEVKDANLSIIALREKNYISIQITSIKEELHIPLVDQEELEYVLSRDEDSDNFFNEFLIENSSHPILKFISSINAPLFLGLERRQSNTDDFSYKNRPIRRDKHGRLIRKNRLINGSLGISLMEVQDLVRISFERIRKIEERHRKTLRDEIILSSFQYTEFSSFVNEKGEFQQPSWQDKEFILGRKEEIEKALSNIGAEGEKFQNTIDDFFKNIDTLFEQMKTSSEGINVEWITNKVQVDKIVALIEVIDEHKSKVDSLFGPINRFISIINNFYNDSGKEIIVNAIGDLKIKRPSIKDESIDALSSGERQLLIIFTHLIFNIEKDKSNVFIIDEPELSLHLRWQELFTESVLKASPNTQFIMATHSPEIVDEYGNNCIGVK